jgi:Zn finger protein HypA/HybF involved in hydrogenase expression
MSTVTTMRRDPRPHTKARAHATDIEPRCWNCGRMLGEELTRPWAVRCSKCKSRNRRESEGTSQPA